MSVASSHRLTRRDGRALLFLIASLTGGPLCAQILDWEAAIGETAPSNSFFTEVEAVEGSVATGVPPAAFACGHFSGDFALPGLGPLSNSVGQDGVVARFDRSLGPPPFNWFPTWLAQASSTANVSIRDLVLDNGGNYYVTGSYTNDVSFSGPPLTLTTSVAGATEGFVAWGDVNTGDFIDAFAVPGMTPTAIALDPTNAIYLAGSAPGAMARRYPPGGGAAFIWTAAHPTGTNEVVGIAVTPDPIAPTVFVLGNGPAPLEVAVLQLDGSSGLPGWTTRMGSNGLDAAGGIAVGFDGDPRVAFASEAAFIQYQSPTTTYTIPNAPLTATHGVLLRIRPDGELAWSTVLGQAQFTTSAMKPTGLSIDRFGNTFTCAGFQGGFLIESQAANGNADVAVLGVDAAGVLFDFHQSTGAGQDSPTGVAAPARDIVVTVGQYEGSPGNFGGQSLPVPNPGEIHAFLGALGPLPGQNQFILTPIPGAPGAPTVLELIVQIHQTGGQVYNVVQSATTPRAVSAYLTTDQLADLTAPGNVTAEPDSPLQPDGSSVDADWALNHLNAATNTGPGPYTFTYADTGQAVNVYLLDTAASNPSAWFNTNTNLTIAGTTLVRGTGDPLVSSVFQHGTEMMSLIAGPNTGSALGVPVTLKNFDFYPTGAPTTTSLLADAIYQAIDYHLDYGDCKPGVIIISSSGAGSSSAVNSALGEAIAEGIPVIVSAGNANANASGYVPASSGTTSGIVCVAGNRQNRTKEAGSNHTTIDCSAPGDAVRVINFPSPGSGYGSFTGTSASAALTAGVAAAYLSVNPWATPAQLESALTGDAYLDGGSGLSIIQLASAGPAFFLTYDDWTAYHGLADDTHAGDDDGDGWTNLDEYFRGLKPTKADPKGAQAWITYNPSTNKYNYTFHISSVLLDPASLGTLRDGGTYEVTDSTTATGFRTAPGTLTVGSSTGTQTELSLENTVFDPKCFFQLDISPASPSP
ncbi:MAG: S8 family serine peptidase [Verrucomicrobia bacterium]|nr:S8 family serine peptidase [Verrucomicrobiota bacterium]MDA1006291.1 S8 family serine peptidase [Verrucomicrobiota bacterium]